MVNAPTASSSIDHLKFGVVIVGAGYWGQKCISAVQNAFSHAEIFVCDPRLPADHRFDQGNFRTSLCTLQEALQNSSIGAAIVCTPVATHGELALELLRAGKSVLVEKPFGLGEQQIEEARQHEADGLRVSPGYLYFFNPAVGRIKKIIEDGNLGQLRFVEAHRLGFGAFRRDVSPVRDLMVHDFSILMTWFPELEFSVSRVDRRFPLQTNQYGEIAAEVLVNEVLPVRLVASHLRTSKTRQMTLVFDEGIVNFDEMSAEPLKAFRLPSEILDSGKRSTGTTSDYLDPLQVNFSVELKNPVDQSLLLSISSFLESALLGKTNPLRIDFAVSVGEMADAVDRWPDES